MLEHRHGSRTLLTKKIDIFVDKQGPIQGIINNISAQGLLLRCDNELVRNRSIVRIEFCSNDRRYELTGLVVHKNADKIGIMLRGVQQNALSVLAHQAIRTTRSTESPPRDIAAA